MDKLVLRLKKVPGLYILAAIGRALYSVVRSRSLKTVLFSPPGHFYSPLPSLKEFRAGRQGTLGQGTELRAVDLRPSGQLELLTRFAEHYGELPFADEPVRGLRYHFSNQYFRHADAIILYSVLRHFRPARVVEVGSGFSSALMLDTDDGFLDQSIRFTFVEPFPGRLRRLMSEGDEARCRIVAKPVQEVSPEIFTDLDRNDVLFVDSSHVAKVGSDVCHLIFRVLPALRPGVIVHFHDVFWPFEYPREWVLEGRAWNEAYLLRAFLQYNRTFEILYFNSYMGSCQAEEVGAKLPLCLKDTGGSLWLRKKR